MSRLERRIEEISSELVTLTNRQRQINDRISNRCKNKFVAFTRTELYVHSQITQLGLEELEKHGIEYLSEPDPNEFFYPGISYKAGDISCLVCGSKNIYNTMSMGFAPRFAACAKHNDFLFLVRNLKKL